MELKQLAYFRTVAKLENMTLAAKTLHIAQPSLSKMIARLEEELQLTLFDRKGKRIYLNQYGKSFLLTVNRIFHELEGGKKELADLAAKQENTVIVGASSSRILQDLFKEFFAIHPERKFKIRHIRQQQDLEDKLLEEAIDLGIFYTPIKHPAIACIPLLVEEIYLAVPPAHPLAKKKSIALEEAAGESFISVITDTAFGEMTTRFCQEAGFTPNVAFEIESFDIIVNLVDTGLGLTFIPASWQTDSDQHSPILLKIDSPLCQRRIWLSWLKERYQTQAMLDFRDFSLAYFQAAFPKK